jgi:putative ABC transport system permease protein
VQPFARISQNCIMEEYIWFLVELFISGKATEAEASELVYLLATHPDLLTLVKEFLNEYNDPDPQVTSTQKQALLNRVVIGQITRLDP